MYQLTTTWNIAQPGTLTRWLDTFLHVPSDKLVGCSETEISAIESAAGLPLPPSYRQMMREAGKSIGSGRIKDHFDRSFLTYPGVLEVREVALEIAADPSVLAQAFPFYNWEVYDLCLLDLSQERED